MLKISLRDKKCKEREKLYWLKSDETQNMEELINKMRTIAERLEALGKPVSDEEMVMILLMLYLVLWVPYIVMAKGDQVAGVQPALPRSASSGTRTRWRCTGTSPSPTTR